MEETATNHAEQPPAASPGPDLEHRIEEWWRIHFAAPVIRCDSEILSFIRRAVDDLKTRLV